MAGFRFSPATVASVFSLAVGVAVCLWGYQELGDAYRDFQETRHGAPSAITRHHETADEGSNAEREPELGEAGLNAPREAPSPNHP